MNFPSKEMLLDWIDDFPEYASHGVSFTDFNIIKEAQEQQKKLGAYKVLIGSLDRHLTP